MPRPKRCRRVSGRLDDLGGMLFKPAGRPARDTPETVLSLDELEALRLADMHGLHHGDAAARMNVSRQTFGRIVAEARRKVADALVMGRSLRIYGGNVEMAGQRHFACNGCGHNWNEPCGTGRPAACPECEGTEFCRADKESCGGHHGAHGAKGQLHRFGHGHGSGCGCGGHSK